MEDRLGKAERLLARFRYAAETEYGALLYHVSNSKTQRERFLPVRQEALRFFVSREEVPFNETPRNQLERALSLLTNGVPR